MAVCAAKHRGDDGFGEPLGRAHTRHRRAIIPHSLREYGLRLLAVSGESSHFRLGWRLTLTNQKGFIVFGRAACRLRLSGNGECTTLPVLTSVAGEPVSNASTDPAVRLDKVSVMLTYQDSKMMAKALRDELSRRDMVLSHGQCLDVIARLFGFDNWNILAAKLESGNSVSPPATVGGSALPLPTGWTFEGSRLDYDGGVDVEMRYGAGHPAVIRSRFSVGEPTGAQSRNSLAALVQELDASIYRGKRLRLQAKLKTEAVIGAATIWLQVDRTRHRDVLVLDNMEDRASDGALVGTQNWRKRFIVLDVPHEATVIHYGFYLRGSGSVWASGFDLREADPGDVVTKEPKRLLSGPINLDFSKLDRLAS